MTGVIGHLRLLVGRSAASATAGLKTILDAIEGEGFDGAVGTPVCFIDETTIIIET